MIFFAVLCIVALFVSSVSAFFAVHGLTAIFPNATIPIVSMGIAIEAGKLTAASFVYRYWNLQKVMSRFALLGMTIMLSLLTSVGVFGFLSRQHIEGTGDIATSVSQVEAVERQIEMEQSNVTFLQQTLAQGDRVVNNYLTDTMAIGTISNTRRAELSRNRLMAERRTTQAQIAEANATLLELGRQRDSLAQIQRIKEVDVGPLKYLAALISPDIELDIVVRWFILALVLVLDPLALLLVVAANMHWKQTRPKSEEKITFANVKNTSHLEESPFPEPDGTIPATINPVPKELDFRKPEKWQSPAP